MRSKLIIVILLLVLISSFTLGLGYSHFNSKESIELNYMCGANQSSITLTEPNGEIDDNDLWELDRQCALEVSDIRNNKGDKLVKEDNGRLYKFDNTQYYCKARDIYYDCDEFSQYYGLETGKCISEEGNKLCRTGWILI